MTRPAVPRAALDRAIKAVEAAGLAVTGVTLAPGGAVTLLTRPAGSAPMSDFDRWAAEQANDGKRDGRAA